MPSTMLKICAPISCVINLYIWILLINGEYLEFGHVDFSTRLDGFVFKYIHSVSQRDCWVECNARANCLSFNYLQRVLRCELNTKRISDLGLDASTTNCIQYVYWEREETLEKIACGSNICNKTENCDVHTKTCLIKECRPIQDIGFGDLLGNMNDIGSKAVIMCNSEVNIRPSSGETVTTECQADGQWSYRQTQSLMCPPVWTLVFRGTPGIGVDIYQAWITGDSTTTNDVTCKQLNVTSCTRNYRNPIVDSWSDLSISKVKYSMYRDGKEVAYVTFDGTGSGITNWFSQNRVLNSSWEDIKTVYCNFFLISGNGGRRRFFINKSYGGCPNDRVYTLIVTSGGCDHEQHSSYPQFLYANSTSHVRAEDFVRADVMAIHIWMTDLVDFGLS